MRTKIKTKILYFYVCSFNRKIAISNLKKNMKVVDKNISAMESKVKEGKHFTHFGFNFGLNDQLSIDIDCKNSSFDNCPSALLNESGFSLPATIKSHSHSNIHEQSIEITPNMKPQIARFHYLPNISKMFHKQSSKEYSSHLQDSSCSEIEFVCNDNIDRHSSPNVDFGSIEDAHHFSTANILSCVKPKHIPDRSTHEVQSLDNQSRLPPQMYVPYPTNNSVSDDDRNEHKSKHPRFTIQQSSSPNIMSNNSSSSVRNHGRLKAVPDQKQHGIDKLSRSVSPFNHVNHNERHARKRENDIAYKPRLKYQSKVKRKHVDRNITEGEAVVCVEVSQTLLENVKKRNLPSLSSEQHRPQVAVSQMMDDSKVGNDSISLLNQPEKMSYVVLNEATKSSYGDGVDGVDDDSNDGFGNDGLKVKYQPSNSSSTTQEK